MRHLPRPPTHRRTKKYLLDKSRGVVYDLPSSSGGWPHPAGYLLDRQFVPKPTTQTTGKLLV